MKIRLVCAGLATLAALAACQRAADLRHAEADIRATDAHWLAAAQAHDLERTLSFWSDDAILMQPGSAPLAGKDALRKYVKDSFAIPGFSISWVIDRVWIAQSGDLAYATGRDEIRLMTPDGKRVVEHNNSVGIWRKGPDGGWKCAVDIWNSAGPQS
ncbi:MAG TPA: DUF4440 domain-containing protein [Steroidobacteraceae bacterium]|nr:DUF4440 domain-containing protein [Steroidobacteraceae bacterium]